MSEVDIWIKVMDKLGFLFIEEKCLPFYLTIKSQDTSFLEYICIQNNWIYRIYLNRNTKEINSISCIGGVTKESFYNKHLSIFREVKLNSVGIE